MADIFISYARADRDKIEMLAATLEAKGFSVWWDRHIKSGSEFSVDIERELDLAKAVVVCWSKDGSKSRWVKDEAGIAAESSKLLAVALDSNPPPIGFRQFHTLDFSTWGGDDSATVCGELTSSLESRLQNNAPKDARINSAPTKKNQKTSIAVLPFTNISGDQDKEYFADGILEDLVSSLARNKQLSVTARTTVFALKGKSLDVREIRADLGVDFIVEGSIRTLGSRLRIAVQLIRTESEDHLWAEKFDVTIDELFDVQDQIINRISATLGAQLKSAEYERIKAQRPDQLSTWEVTQQAAGTFSSDALSPARLQQVATQLKQAVAKDPEYAYGHSVLAWLLFSNATSGYTDDWRADFKAAAGHLKIGLELARGDALNLFYCGVAASHSGDQKTATSLLQRSLKENPNNADALLYLGVSHAYSGDFENAYAALDQAEAMAPTGGFAPCHSFFRGKIKFLEGRHREVLNLLEQYIRTQPEHSAALIFYALSQAMTGATEKAIKSVRQAFKAKPDLQFESIAMFVTTHPDKQECARRLETLRQIWPEKNMSENS